MNKKIVLLTGVLVLAISNVIADKDPDVTWVVDVTNKSMRQIFMGGAVPSGGAFSGNCWVIPDSTLNDFFSPFPLRSGESRRRYTVEIAHSKAYMGDHCTTTSQHVLKFMDTYIGGKVVRFEAQYHPQYTKSTDHNPLAATNDKNMWSVLVDGVPAAAPKEMTGEFLLKPYVHIIYGRDGQITAEIGTQDEDMPAAFYANDKW